MNARAPSLSDLVGLANRWIRMLTPVAGPLTTGEDLAELAGRLALDAGAGLDNPAQADLTGRLIGRQLAVANLTGPEAPARAITALGDHWCPGSGLDPACVTAMQGGIAAGHSEAVQQLLLTQQEAIHRATVDARNIAQDRLHREVVHDRLTGLANRAHFLHRLNAALTGPCDDSGGRVVLCLLDLTGFAAINLCHGHHNGDILLEGVAGRLSAAVEGTSALLARFGDDEFAVLQPASSPDAAEAVTTGLTARLLAALHAPIPLEDAHPLHITARTGCVVLAVGRTTLDAALRAADLALRSAKSAPG